MVSYVNSAYGYVRGLWETPIHELKKEDGIGKNYKDAMENIVTLGGRAVMICAAGTILALALSILKVGGTVGAVAAFTWKASLLTGTLAQAAILYIANLQNQIDSFKD
ncbi:MAG TPA: hypothetical protein PKW79_00930 [Rhabdochlamydiaceae bacterium]|nr:hypothetical protein [Rhabdochlamydiaceae bacterium]